jgi:predicted MFS family arabinose efflux permease
MAVGCFMLAASSDWLTAVTAVVLIGACTAPLNTVRSVAVEEEIPTTSKSEGFGLVNAAHSLGFALGGFFLALLPLPGMLAAGGASGMLALALAPAVTARLRSRIPAVPLE